MSQIKHGMPYELKRFPRPGAVDADGHVTEPADVWEKYLENKYKPRGVALSVELRTVTRVHVIAWRKDLEARGLSTARTIYVKSGG